MQLKYGLLVYVLACGSVVLSQSYFYDSSSFKECVYPCDCPGPEEPSCPEGTSPILDQCGCCPVCPRQLGESCHAAAPCDQSRGLSCRHHRRDKRQGICAESLGAPCVVHNHTYEHGETFLLDCRTQCTCQNGTYGCSSLCPQEHISPKGACRHPRLVEVPGQCCREWMCDSQAVEQPPSCQPAFSRWSECSSECGLGLSSRRSNLNAQCQPETETRLCHIRPCGPIKPPWHQHHIRKGHECKATNRLPSPVHLRFGPCTSRKRYRPKYCGGCALRRADSLCCLPLLSTTVQVDFVCPPGPDAAVSDLVEQLAIPGEPMWLEKGQSEGPSSADWRTVTVPVQWTIKCHCVDDCQTTKNLIDGNGEVILHRVHRTASP